jgi:hypothetical protein
MTKRALVKEADAFADELDYASRELTSKALERLAELRANALEGAIKGLVAEAFDAGVAWAARRKMSEKQRLLMTGDEIIGAR